ncbi:MAG: 2-hydroxychromene-2-carboxylate isomerase [Deltaproteobacteria bacterium]|nr:2-hydroxychromene-2-carboxylate isomerase [Deltaproteobacteria bacterium]
MPRRLDFWFDYTCPYAYLASTQVESLARRTGDELHWRPMLLGGVFRANATPQKLFATLSPQKAKHNADDLERWSREFDAPLRMPPGHPMRSVEALRATLATSCDPAVIHGFFRAYWVDNREISDPATMRDVLTAAGHDADAVLPRVAGEALRDALRRETEQAVALGIFGAPAYVIDGAALYWGQDRAHFVEGLTPERYLSQPTKEPSMAHTLEIYWDFSSPFAYLGATQAKALAERTGATLVWRPMLLGGLFKSIGQELVPLNTWSDAKRRYYFEDMNRWAEFWGVPLNFPAVFPVNSIKALRAYIALPEERRDAFRDAVFRAYWAEGRDIGDEAVLSEYLGDDAAQVLARTNDPEVKKALVDATKHAESAGVFGAPTWVVDGTELYWGQDRIPLVERALRR